MSRRDRGDRRDGGFTLTELLVVMTLTGIIGGIVTVAVTTGLHKQTQVQDRNDALAQMRTAMQRVSRDIRSSNPLCLAEDKAIWLQQVQAAGTRTMAYSIVADGANYDLVADNYTAACNTITSTTPYTRTTLLRNIVNDASTPVFTYQADPSYAAPSTVAGSTCAISSTSPVQYDTHCVQTVTLHLEVQPSTLLKPIDLIDNGTELRNRT
jgi:prepilin-type N-terminal cleavage/methylation domain-containing protein